MCGVWNPQAKVIPLRQSGHLLRLAIHAMCLVPPIPSLLLHISLSLLSPYSLSILPCTFSPRLFFSPSLFSPLLSCPCFSLLSLLLSPFSPNLFSHLVALIIWFNTSCTHYTLRQVLEWHWAEGMAVAGAYNPSNHTVEYWKCENGTDILVQPLFY